MQMQFQTEAFEETPIQVVIFAGERWLRGPQIAEALGFKNPSKAISDIYSRNRSEFDDSTNLMIEMPTGSGRQIVRLYNARGAALIAMKAQTPKGEAFRRWVLDVLEGKASVDDEAPIAAGQMTATVAARLRQMFIETPKMRHLVRHRTQGLTTTEIAKLLEVSRGYVVAQLRVAEFLGLIVVDPKLETYRASPQFQAFIEGKRDYHRRKRAAAKLALAAPTGETVDAQ